MRNHMRKAAASLIAAAAFAMLLMLVNAPVAQAQDKSDTQPPTPWTEAACNGAAAIVIQETEQTGDGVTVGPMDPWQCPGPEVPLLVVEPWDGNADRVIGMFPSKFNDDRACLVDQWTASETQPNTYQAFATRTKLGNGSVWIVDGESYAANPLVVDCSAVTAQSKFGLNPGENQVQVRLLPSFKARAQFLLLTAGQTFQSYVTTHSDPIAELFVGLGWAN